MKKALCFLFAVVLVCLFSIPSFAGGESDLISDEILKGTPEIDGKLDNIYLDSASISIYGASYYVWGGLVEDTAYGTVYLLWDENYLYYCVTVHDDSPVSCHEMENWQNDSVQHWFRDDDQVFLIHHAADSTFYLDLLEWVQDTKHGCTFNFEDSIHTQTMEKEGYTIEGALPFPALKEGRKIFYSATINDVMFEDGTLGAAYGTEHAAFKFTCSATAAKSHQDETTVADDVTTSVPPTDTTVPDKVTDANINDAPADTAQKPSDNAPQTADVAMAGLAVVAVLSLAGAVIVKKIK